MITVEELQNDVTNCFECPLGNLETNKFRTLPNGYVASSFMIVGMNPSQLRTDSTKHRFIFNKEVSEHGVLNKNYELLKKMLANVALDLDTCWKSNVLKCTPGSESSDEHFSKCGKIHLTKEIKEVAPKLVIALGTKVGNFFGVTEKFKIVNSKEFNVDVVVVHHPSYCTRNSITEEEFISQLEPISDEIEKIRNNVFINYHHHNHFSLRDGLGDEPDVAKRLVELKSPAFCLTNHGNVNCHYRQWKSAKKYGMKTIFGTEFYYNEWRDKIMDVLKDADKEAVAIRKDLGKYTFHLTVIAKNEQGYLNLISMNNEALMNSFYKFPLIDDKLLDKYREGLLVFSGCPGAFIPVNLFANENAAYEKANLFKDLFKDNFYIELMSTRYDHQIDLNNKLVKLSKDLKVPTLITNDTHYIREKDSRYHDIWLLSGTDNTLDDISDPAKKTWTFSVKDLFVKDTDLVRKDLEYLKSEHYTSEVIEESLTNIHQLFTKIDQFDINTSMRYPRLSDEDSVKTFDRLLKYGIQVRRKGQVDPKDPKFLAQLEEEYKTIHDLGFLDYFIVLQDMINWCKDTYGRYSVGAGRGSAAASLISYLFGITDVNPLKYPFMLFERFMSPGRKDAPDIDSDFAPSVRSEVIEYAIKRFGRNNVFPVGTYGTVKLKMAIHDVLKALGAEFSEILQYTKKIPNEAELEYGTVDDAIARIPELKILFDKYPEAKPAAESIRNKVRSIGQHAGGIVISGVDLTKTIPLARTSAGTFVTSNTEGGDFHEITEMGFVKYDMLSLTTIDNILDCTNLIKDRWNFDPNWEEILDNEEKYSEMYKILQIGDCFGIFQFSSQLAIGYLKDMLPRDLNDLCAASGLIRPGPLDQAAHMSYANRKNGKEEYQIPAPIEPYLKDTFGMLVYQEQFLRIVQDVCGLSKEEGSVLRKALVKYERSIVHETKRKAKVASFQARVEAGFLKAGMTAEESRIWWDYIESFSRYGFNFAHSMSYAYLSFRQLWQKFYYTIEFYTSLLNNSSIEELISVIQNMYKFPARKTEDGKTVEYKITLLPPDLRKMNGRFTIEGDQIRHGLLWTKYISADSYAIMKKHLEKEDLEDLDKLFSKKYEKNGKQKFIIDKKIASALIYSGALDYFGKTKAELAEYYNTFRKSNIDVVSSEIELDKLKRYYIGYNIGQASKIEKIREKLHVAYGLPYLSMLAPPIVTSGESIDCFTVQEIKQKQTKRGKPFRTLKVSTIDGETINPIFIWDDSIRVDKEKMYVGKFEKEGSFIKIKEIILI